MTEGADDGGSPWERDDWMPADQPPVEFDTDSPAADHRGAPITPDGPSAAPWVSPAPAGTAAPAPTSPTPTSPRARLALVGGGVVVAVVAIAAFALNGSDDPPSAGADSTTLDSTDAPASTAPRTTTPRTTVERTTVPVTIVTRSVDPHDSDEIIASSAFIAVRPALGELVVGEVPEWTDWKIPMIDPIDVIQVPTEIVIAGRGVVHRLEVPSGNIRSLAVLDSWDSSGQVAVAGDTVALSSFDDVLLLRDGLPAIKIEVGSINGLRARPGTLDFLVSVSDANGTGQRNLVVGRDGSVTELDQPWFDQSWPGTMAISPSGELFTAAPGGIYGLDPASGVVRRVDDGHLAGSGVNHLLVQRCDETLSCGYQVVDLRDGTTSPVAPFLDSAGGYGYDWPRLSPDGTKAATMTWGPGQPSLRIYTVATGEYDASEQLNWYGNEPWAADSSGLFWSDGVDSVIFRAVDGRTAKIGGFGGVAQLAVQPAPVAAG